MMSDIVLRTKNVTKKYGNFKALDNVSISIEQGRIYGLIGQNGAGKTTLMRAVAGLTFPTSGEIELFKTSSQNGLEDRRKLMGTMIEDPAIIGHLSAEDNLKAQCLLKGVKDKAIIDEVLELVGLHHTGKKKAKDFSLGMKQRLGIAITLLNNPKILMLDEPINGLDPKGVVEIRNLLKDLCHNRGITILLSSHNLSELFQTVTDFIIINHGHVIKTISRDELERHIYKRLVIDSNDNSKVIEVLNNELQTKKYSVQDNNVIHLYDYINDKERVSKALIDHDVIVTTFMTKEDTLEEYYLKLIHGERGLDE